MIKKGKVLPGADFKFKEAAVCVDPTVCIYTISEIGSSGKSIIGSGGLLNTKNKGLLWFDHNDDGTKRDDVAGDAFFINNDKKNSTTIMKILKIKDN